MPTELRKEPFVGPYDGIIPAVLAQKGTISDGKNKIPFERLFISTPYSPKSDKGAGPGYESLDKPRLVARGSFTAPMAIMASSLNFRLLTKWDDKPGTYSGAVRFTYITNP